MKNEFTIAVNAPAPGIIVTLENTGAFFGVLASFCLLAGIAISIISKINKISFVVNEIEENLKLHATNSDKLKELDKRFDIHLQDYVNYKDANLMRYNQLHELIEHKWDRSEEEFKALESSIKELQHFLQKKDAFKIRE